MKMRIYLGILVLGVLCFALGRTTAGRTPVFSEQTRENLSKAMHGEAFAYAKYSLFAQLAREKGQTAVADLFESTAKVERLEHFAEEAQLAGLAGTEAENLKDAIQGESYEVETMYREFAEKARAAGDQKAADLFEEIRRDEMGHRDSFKAALAKVEINPAGQ